MEQMTLFELVRPRFEVNNKIRLIETFAGYGSQSMALKRLGADFEHYRVYEIDRFAMASFNAVHGTNFEPTDIKTVKGVDMGIVDKERFTYLLTYSFPCTDISIAGRMAGMAEGSDTRSSLLWEIKRILSELAEINALPQVLVMENVTQIHSDDNILHFRKWVDFLTELGYTSYGEDLNAADYGIPQHRERTFLVSLLGDYNYKFPVPIDTDYCIEDFFEDMTEEQAEQFVMKSQKALELLVRLDDEERLN